MQYTVNSLTQPEPTNTFDMLMNEYQADARRTASMGTVNRAATMMILTLGLVGEAGEVAELVKHAMTDAGDLPPSVDLVRLTDELGDVLWYLATMANMFHIPLSRIAAYNLAKLQARYPDGQFDPERSMRRHEAR